MHLDDVAADFPDMTVIIAHPSWPWQDEALSVCLHKPNVYIDLSGWSPKYFPPQLVQYANTQLKTQDAVRLGLSADHAGPLDEGFQGGGVQARSAPTDPEGERHPRVRALARSASGSIIRKWGTRDETLDIHGVARRRTLFASGWRRSPGRSGPRPDSRGNHGHGAPSGREPAVDAGGGHRADG